MFSVQSTLGRFRTAGILALAALAAGLALAGPARAELTICNNTAKPLSIAIGYKGDTNWVSEGWWNIAVDACQDVVDGDLTNRHYYYRDFNDRIAGEGYYFCTKTDAFTIKGDAECAARGYERAEFAHLDTGDSPKTFTLTINGAPSAVSDAERPITAPQKQADSLPPVGTYGEPFSVTGTNQGCDRIDGLLSCQIDGEGWLYTAYDDNRNLMETLDYIDSLPIGADVTLSGDMVSYGDTSADVVVREIALVNAPPSNGTTAPMDYAATDMALQGYWQSLDDPNAMIAFFAPSDMEDYYEGELLSSSDYFLSDACPDEVPNGGLYLIATDREYSDTLCYAIMTLDEYGLELMYLPRGNILRYGPADF